MLNTNNTANPPYYVQCNTDNNDLGLTKVYADIGYCIVNTIEDVVLRVGLWDGGASLEELQ